MVKKASKEELAIAEALSEINTFCIKYEEENKKCVSYYMIAAYAYIERKESWISLLHSSMGRDCLSWGLRGRRAQSKYPYGMSCLEAKKQYLKAWAEYEKSKGGHDGGNH